MQDRKAPFVRIHSKRVRQDPCMGAQQGPGRPVPSGALSPFRFYICSTNRRNAARPSAVRLYTPACSST